MANIIGLWKKSRLYDYFNQISKQNTIYEKLKALFSLILPVLSVKFQVENTHKNKSNSYMVNSVHSLHSESKRKKNSLEP